jgi:fused signal recognition particle receptor
MGLFSKLKEKFSSKKEVNKVEKKETEIYEKGLEKTRKDFSDKLNKLNKKYSKVNQEYFEELEEILIMADIGVNTVIKFMDRLVDRAKKEKIEDPETLKELIVDELFIIYVNDEVLVNKINYRDNGPTVILFVGVNGVGKTTTIAKIAKKEKDQGKKVLLVAADTFRAGAVEQLSEWANRLGVDIESGEEGIDPASVVYSGMERAKDYDLVLIDTAGRLQNKVNLMNELEKIKKVINNHQEGSPEETLLVIDATTGQNGISQAKAFKEITDVTGIVLTKLDGSAKGGIVLAIKEEVNIPVKYVGMGEKEEDLRVFDIEKYIYGLFKEMM